MDILTQEIGKEGTLDIDVVGGQIVLSAKHVHASGEVVITAKEDVGYFLDKLAAKIPGAVDDAIIAVIKSALKAL
jgi:hypothetical protein